MQSGFSIPGQFKDQIERLSVYLNRIAHFPFHWARPGSTPDQPDFFRYDAERLARMINSAEHFLRCLIIWMAWLRLHHGEVTPRRISALPKPIGRRPVPEEDMHPDFALRALPLRTARLPAFRISLPDDRGAATPRANAKGKRSAHRPRNDDTLSGETLIARAERLDKILEDLDARATRYASWWAGRLLFDRQSTEPAFTPLKHWQPPPDILDGAPPDEEADLLAIHDVACRAAAAFEASPRII